jgi:hypothetical protein
MKNAFSRIGRTCASFVIGGGLMAGALLAGNVNEIGVTLPHAVAVGSTTLPSGHYTISSFEMGSEEYFVVRSDRGTAVATLQAQPIDGESDSKETKVVFSKDGDTWHFDKLELAGEGASYQFLKQ